MPIMREQPGALRVSSASYGIASGENGEGRAGKHPSDCRSLAPHRDGAQRFGFGGEAKAVEDAVLSGACHAARAGPQLAG